MQRAESTEPWIPVELSNIDHRAGVFCPSVTLRDTPGVSLGEKLSVALRTGFRSPRTTGRRRMARDDPVATRWRRDRRAMRIEHLSRQVAVCDRWCQHVGLRRNDRIGNRWRIGDITGTGGQDQVESQPRECPEWTWHGRQFGQTHARETSASVLCNDNAPDRARDPGRC